MPSRSDEPRLREAASRIVISLACALAAMLPACDEKTPGDDMPPTASQPASPEMVALVRVADGLTSPVDMTIPDDDSGRLFIVDQIGKVHIIDDAGDRLPTPFLDVADHMVDVGIDFGGGFIFDERGLLSLAFHPDYASNRRFYVVYNAPKEAGDPNDFDSRLRLSEFLTRDDDPDVADETTERVLLEILKPQFNHNGGQIAFGPDGMLYMSVGDGGMANDVGVGHTPGLGNAQDKSKLLGKILRIDVDGADPYGIPADNPFVGEAGVRGEIWAFGLRNPFRFSFDTEGARRMFCGDAGQDVFEEVHIIGRGDNLGWNIREGLHCFDPNAPANPPADCPDAGADGEPLVDPIIEYPHFAANAAPVGIVVIGGHVYHGDDIAGLDGDYVFGDFSTSFGAADGTLFAATEDAAGEWTHRELAVAGSANGRVNRFVLGFGRDQDGEVYVLTTANLAPAGTTGEVYRLAPAP
jgi:glucose/arabinose dehydrogenase